MPFEARLRAADNQLGFDIARYEPMFKASVQEGRGAI
jgi:hypothetical protein